MQRKKKFVLAVMLLVAIVLLLPFSCKVYEDGGTRTYAALTYKIVQWNRLDSVYNQSGNIEYIDVYQETAVYWFPNNFKSIDELWEMKKVSN